MTNDYFPRPRRETKIEAETEGSAQKKITPEDRKEIERYLSRHDEFFGLGPHISVGDDPEARDD